MPTIFWQFWLAQKNNFKVHQIKWNFLNRFKLINQIFFSKNFNHLFLISEIFVACKNSLSIQFFKNVFILFYVKKHRKYAKNSILFRKNYYEKVATKKVFVKKWQTVYLNFDWTFRLVSIQFVFQMRSLGKNLLVELLIVYKDESTLSRFFVHKRYALLLLSSQFLSLSNSVEGNSIFFEFAMGTASTNTPVE